jgi:DNA-binding transcriptional regulator YiaG
MDKLLGIRKYFQVLASSTANRQGKCKAIRKKYEFKVKEIAEFLSVTPQTIYRWEREGLSKT